MTYLINKKTTFAVLTTLVLVMVLFTLMTHTVSAVEESGTPSRETSPGEIPSEGTPSRGTPSGVTSPGETPSPTPQPTRPQSGASLGGALSGLALPQLVLVTAVLFILKGILTVIMGVVALGLQYAYTLNLTALPESSPAVLFGWKILRDITNSFFILIILWIAFTIIFNIEHLGGKKLLLRVVIVALLINFSLAMVTTVFGLTNIMANTFAKNIPRDVPGFIADIWSLQNLGTQNEREIAAAKDAARAEPGTMPGTGEVNPLGSLKNSLFASVGIKQSQAQGGTIGGLVGGCAIGIFAGPAGCAIGAVAGGVMGAIADLSGVDVTGATAKVALREGMVVIYLLLATAAFLLAMIALFMRLIAMMVLAIFAPVAFLLYVVPSKMASKYFDQWLNALFRWAFFAPIFYFLFYLSLLMIQTAKPKTFEDPSLNPERFIVLIISLGLIWAAVKFARKSSGVVGETAIGLGKMAGMLALGGAGALAARSATVALSKEGVQKKMRGWAEKPGRRWLGGAIPMKATGKFLEGQRQKIDKKRETLKTRSDDDVLSELRGAVFPQDRTALLQEASTRGLFTKTENIRKAGGIDRLRNITRQASDYGAQKEALQNMPYLITTDEDARRLMPGATSREDALKKIVKGTDDRSKIGPNPDGTYDPTMLRAILSNIRGKKEIQKINQQNAFLFRALEQEFTRYADQLERDLNMETPGQGQGTALKAILERQFAANQARARRPAGRPRQAAGFRPRVNP